MLIDAHAHIDRYADNLTEALHQINHHQILTVAVSMDIPSYLKTMEIAGSCRYILPAFGIHPWNAESYKNNLDQLDKYLAETPLIGEAGLDFFWEEDKTLYPGQIIVFEYQCQWAQRLSKPLNLHTRGAECDVLKTLERFHLCGSLVHWYSGPLDLIDSYLSLGCYFTIGVEVLTSKINREIAEIMPADRILLETDNPDGYQWLHKQQGMPELLLEVLHCVAGIKGFDAVAFEQQMTQNWQHFTKNINSVPIMPS